MIVNHEIHVQKDLNMNLFMNVNFFLDKHSQKPITLSSSNIKLYNKLWILLGLKNLFKSASCITCGINFLTDYILIAYPKCTSQREVIIIV